MRERPGIESFHLRPDDYPKRPWKNGGGETREIASDTQDPFRWRLSWATIPGSGPFSPFPGYDRQLVIWRGGPVSIAHEGKPPRHLNALQVASFKGEWETEASVSAPAEDFNAFALRGEARVGVYPTFFAPGEDQQFPIAGSEHFLFGVEGEIEILEANTDRRFVLKPQETVRVSRQSTKQFLNLRARGLVRSSCLWIVVRLL